MNTKLKTIIILAVCIFSFDLAISAQTETLDVTTFTPPVGWTKQSKEGVAMYVNSSQTSYCIIAVYKSKPGSGNVEIDFQNEWKELIVKPFQVTNPPQLEPVQDNEGWKGLAGSASFTGEAGTSAALLTTVSGYGKTASIMVILNNQEFMPTIEKFLNSVKFSKPTVNNSPTSLITQSTPVSSSGGSSGISISATTFEDGWTATIHDDYVLVSKGDTNLRLFYPAALNDQARNNTSQYFWNTVVTPRYNVSSPIPWPGPSYDFIYFIEGSGTDKQTGQSQYIAMRVVTFNGMGSVILATAPDKQSYSSQFPHPDKLRDMLNANRFAITQADLIGNWKGGFGGAQNLYNIYTGSYAGMNMLAGSEEFTFDTGGTYQSRLAGATGQVGNSKFYDKKYGGPFSVTNWGATLSNFNERSTIEYDAYFEAVKGGRILHLTQKDARGNQFHLVKVK